MQHTTSRKNCKPIERKVRKRLSSLKPSPENESIYRKVDPDAPDIVELAESIRKNGLHEALIITRDNYIVSGHRRYAALLRCKQKQVPCRVIPCRRSKMPADEYIALLRDHNRQRDKSAAETIREAVIDVDPKEAVANLKRRRQQSLDRANGNPLATFHLNGKKSRWRISSQKAEHVEFAQRVIEERRKWWPLSVRTVHYGLLNHAFFRNTKQRLRYENDQLSYKATVNLLVRLRFDGQVPWEAIADETRPVKLYRAFENVRDFIAHENNRFLDGYWRDLLQTQPNYVEVLVEKNTVKNLADTVCEAYQVPTCSARGFNSVDSLYEISKRYHASGKEALRLIVLADYDPEGERLTNNAGITLRDEFGIENVHVEKVGVTRDQIERFNLPSQNVAKEKSKHLAWFLQRTGGSKTTYELEAIDPVDLQQELDQALRQTLDMELFSAEVAREEEEATELERVRLAARKALKSLI